MKSFFKKVLLFMLVLVTVNLILLFTVPKDCNNYLCEYNHKVELIEKTSQPRIIIIGGSNIAFGINSQTLMDSLHMNVVNFGLHGGIGIRYLLEDCLQYVNKGDIVMLQMEYGNFKGGNGEPETFLPLMVATDWRKLNILNFQHWKNIVLGVPQVAIANLKRLIKYPFIKSFDSPIEDNKFAYLKSGFNEYGDEVSHLSYPKESILFKNIEEQEINEDFMDWLRETIQEYEEVGTTILMLPPVCISSSVDVSNTENISKALDRIGHPYIADPLYMALDDSCAFNTRYHVNAEGVKQNTAHIIEALKKHLQSSH